MATPILSHSITQFQLARYAALSNQLEVLKAEQAALQQKLISELSSGASVEAGARSASLKTCERRSVAWKDVVIRLRGNGYVQNVLTCSASTIIPLVLPHQEIVPRPSMCLI